MFELAEFPISADPLELRGKDLMRCAEGQMRAIRGHEIAMVFQDPTGVARSSDDRRSSD